MLGPAVVVQAALLALGVAWIREVVARFSADLEELRTSADGSARAVIVLVWVATAVVLGLSVDFVIRLAARFAA